MSDYWFFLSYARRTDASYTLASDDKARKLIGRLYEDLAADIIGAPMPQPGRGSTRSDFSIRSGSSRATRGT